MYYMTGIKEMELTATAIILKNTGSAIRPILMAWRKGEENCNLNKSPAAKDLKLTLFQISEDSNIYLLLNSR